MSGQAIVRWLARIAADGRSSDAMAAARALAELPRSPLAVVRVDEDALGGLVEISPRRLEAALDELSARRWVERLPMPNAFALSNTPSRNEVYREV